MSKTDYIYEKAKDKFIGSNYGKYILYFMFSSLLLSSIPLAALIVYMDYNKFFSYDFFIEGLFSQKIFFIYALVFISICSIIFTGFVIFLIQLIMNYNEFKYINKKLKKRINLSFLKFIFFILFSKREKLILSRKMQVIESYYISIFFGIFLLVVNASIFSLIFEIEELKDKYKLYIVSSVFSILFNILLYSIFSKNIKFKFYSLIITCLMTNSIMFMNKDVTSDLLCIAFGKFSIGGLIYVNIKEINKDNTNNSWNGKLILLTPKNIYLKDSNNDLILIERTNKEIKIIEKTPKK